MNIDKVLAFYSQMNDVELELFDCGEADKNLESISHELDRLAKDRNPSSRQRR